ncbi:MAG TPA: hypothetical protein VK568_17570, partial [Thermodesulfobacteriota bacterium]|nr:hypothetical protein [Thermodesulfobacteriota bacterium]
AKEGGGILGENSVRRHQKIIMAVVFTTFSIFAGIALLRPIRANGQVTERTIPSQESRRDPFLLPPGVHLLSKIGLPQGMKGVVPKTETDAPLKAILIGDHIRLALIDRHIVTVGDSIYGEKVLEIKTDRVVLGKGEQKRTLLLPQSPVPLTVEEKPHLSPPPQKGERTPLEIPAVNQTPLEGPDPGAQQWDIISDEVKEGVKGDER